MAYRREVFSSTEISERTWAHNPVRKFATKDTEFGSRLLAAGERFWYEPSALVYHSVPRTEFVNPTSLHGGMTKHAQKCVNMEFPGVHGPTY